MDEQAGAHIILFGGFRFDRRRGLLSRRNADGGFAPIAIGSRALDVLGLLIDRKGDVVSRDEILNAVWPGVVEGANVTVQISALRRALDDGGSEGGIIRTIPGRGYCFAAAITRSEADPLATVGGNGADRGEAIQPVSSVATSPRARQRAWHGIAALLVVLTVTASMAAWIWDHWSSGGSDTRPRLSLAVLPFTNLGPDPDRDHLADALNAELTTDLSRIPDIFLISRNSSFTYRSRPVDTRQLGRAPGVRYVLEGSVQRSGDHVRVNIQLIDAENRR